MIELLKQHPTLIPVVLTWLANNVSTAFISSLPAPTKDSTANYVFWFKFCNTLAGNLQRAKSTAVEQSPNWKDAVEKHVAMQAGEIPTVIDPPTK